MQKTALVGLGAITTGLAGAGLAGVKFNAQIEQYTATFATFTGSVDEANKTIERLKTLGASTPFEFTELADTTSLLMAYGFSADEAVNSLTMLGDASQGNAEKLTSIATGFARMKSSGKVTLEYLNLMIENGFNPLNQVAEDTGMTMAEVYDAISNGEITFDQVEKAMKKMTSKGGQYFGLMENQSKTMNGMLSTLSDTVQMKLGEAFEVVNGKIVEILPNVISFIDNLDVNDVINGLTMLIGVLGGVFAILTSMRGAIALFNIITTVQQLGGLNVMLMNLSSNIGVVIATIAPVVGIIAGIIAIITAVTLAIKQLWETNEGFRNVVMTAIKGITDTLNNAYNTIIKPVLDNLVKILLDVWNNGIKPLWDNWVAFVGAIISRMADLWNNIKPIVYWFISVFGPVLSNIINSVANAFGSAIRTIINVAGSWLKNITSVVDGIIRRLNGIITFIKGVFTGNWKMAWQGVVDIFGGIFSTLGGLVSAPINAVIGLINGAIGAINSISVDIPKWVPVFGGKHFGLSIPRIPYLEKGGVLKKGQVGLLEGNGAEAVVPLEKNKAWIRAVTKDFVRFMPQVQKGNTTQVNNFYQKVETPDEYAKAMRLQNKYGLAGV
ncbi:tape measure protein [Amedibacterium intestinale]|uniref:tape measure protein n=1 Tax=Amedibacterium intestinale TaxID=2583452 RepID=UPI0039940DAE